MRKIWILCWLLAALSARAQQPLTMDDVVGGSFSEKSVYNVNWMNDGKHITALQEGDIVKIDITTGETVETLLKAEDLEPKIRFSAYEFSRNEQKLLLLTQRTPIYRRSFTAEYFIYDLAAKQLTKLSDNGAQSYATFSPDGSKVAFTRDNNLFFKDLSNGKEVAITTNGTFNELIHGSADWVYEEEFSFAKAFFWSPDGEKIAFYTFDEAQVPEFNMQVWATDQPYPYDYRFKYPKAGEANAKVNISVFHLSSGKTVPVDIGQETDIYIPRIAWTQDANLLSVRKMNRLQNRLEILHADAASGQTTTVLTEVSQTYVDLDFCDDLTYLNDGKHFIHSSEKSGFKHLYLYDMQGKLVRQLTEGNWEVASFLGVDQTAKQPLIYYTSTEASPLERHLYRVRLDGKKKERLTPDSGYHTINISPAFTYYLDYHRTADTPLTVSLFATAKNQQIKLMEDNAALREKAAAYQLAGKEFFVFTTKNGDELNGYIMKPADFDEGKSYPVLMYQYSGPGSQSVMNSWGGGHAMWHQYLVQQGYLVAVVDGRGTGGRGRDFKHVTYGQMGKYEVEDQIATAEYLAQLPYVDAGRIGIWGWSYGGYMSSLCILRGADVFKTAIAVAPVTTWRLYDTIYTERYLKRPQDNPGGYDDNSPISYADRLKGNFLLIHGTGDDNVHFQNAVLLQNALIAAGKQFQSFYYPDRNHGIYGGNTRAHLYQMMTDYLLNNL